MSIYRLEMPLALWMEMQAYAGVVGISIEALLYQVLEATLEDGASAEDCDSAEADESIDEPDGADEYFYCADGLAPV